MQRFTLPTNIDIKQYKMKNRTLFEFKRILLLVAFVATSFSSNAQSYWSEVIDDENLSYLNDKALFQDSIILISGSLNAVSCNHESLIAYNLSGKRLWKNDGSYDVIAVDSHYIYTAGFWYVDDVFGFEKIYLSKLNSQGDTIFVRSLDVGFNDRPNSITLTSKGEIIVACENLVIKSNLEGTHIQEYKPKITTKIKDITCIDNESYLLTTDHVLYKTDSSLNITDSVVFDKLTRDVIVMNDTIYASIATKVLRFDTGLDLIDTVFSNHRLINIECYDENIWTMYEAGDSLYFNNIQNKKHLYFLRLVDNAQFMIAGEEFIFAGASASHQIGVYHIHSKDQREIIDIPNIELDQISVDNIQYTYYNPSDSTHISGFKFRTVIDVKNNGKNTITSLSVLSVLNGGSNCGQNYFYDTLSDLTILPGEVESIDIGYVSQSDLVTDICFEIMAPNRGLEKDVHNNELCKSIVITKTNESVLSDIHLYPNPANSELFVDNLNEGIESIQITDARGVVLCNQQISGDRIEVDVEHLATGFYNLKINLENKVVIKSFQKE